jgi:hypothetical protein
LPAQMLIARHRVQGPAQSVGTLEEQTCCGGTVVDEVSVVGGRLADPSSEMSVVATAPRSEPKAKEMATMITRGFIVSPVVEPSPPPYGEGEWPASAVDAQLGTSRYLCWSGSKGGSRGPLRVR